MKIKLRYLEVFVFLVILYSIITLTFELELPEDQLNTGFFLWSERIVVLIFTIEYVVRWIASRRLSYPFRPMAIVDLLAILPFYLGFMIDLRSIRLVRTVRVFRLLKLYRYTSALQCILNAFKRVRHEFGVVGFAVFTLGLVCSVIIFEFEKSAQPQAFAKLSDAAWYTVVTLTTVGYGDKVPVTEGGRLVAVFMMVAGLGFFGTFVSLIGSSFVEELRRARQGAEPIPAPATSDPAPVKAESAEQFDPGQILKAIDDGEFTAMGEAGNREMTRLLAIACKQLERGGQG